jgi:hypothetical protein
MVPVSALRSGELALEDVSTITRHQKHGGHLIQAGRQRGTPGDRSRRSPVGRRVGPLSDRRVPQGRRTGRPPLGVTAPSWRCIRALAPIEGA